MGMKRYITVKWLTAFCLIFFSMLIQESRAQIFYGDTIIVELPPEQKKAFIKSIHQKIKYLEHYISRIADKDIPIEDRLEMIESAVKLFSHENVMIEISNSITGTKTQYPVRLYFRRLAHLNATKVDITFFQATQLTRLQQAADGYYYGTAILFQETKIYRDPEGIDVYRDQTIKRVNFKSKQEIVRVGDRHRVIMDTLLENIKVLETIPK
jgi:hypothetical protein